MKRVSVSIIKISIHTQKVLFKMFRSLKKYSFRDIVPLMGQGRSIQPKPPQNVPT
jgi:hypothetical protein